MKQIIITEQPGGRWRLELQENQEPVYMGLFPADNSAKALSADGRDDALNEAVWAAYEMAR